jgi:hypothetical protein
MEALNKKYKIIHKKVKIFNKEKATKNIDGKVLSLIIYKRIKTNLRQIKCIQKVF